ncbi:MAG: tRNA lysidine(34) synthetase TilS [Dehalococcoidia bacterium]|nr:tRNA lysidine(34) synthetase TilS [Dehalococcoidia bacterium]
MTPLAARVSRFADQERMFRRTKRVLAAVSGGPDSVALLLVLLEIRERFGLTVQACHFDHQLRPGSRDDLEFVRELCTTLDVPCFSGEGDVRGVARQQRRSIEDAARMMRYQFLAFVAGEKQADCVATGHTAGDQAETVLMRILRGTGVRGIRGMLPVSDLPGSAMRLVRPLLVASREETLAMCGAAGIAPRMDPTNAEHSATRNRVRGAILPALRSENPSVDAALRGLAASAREIFADVERAANGASPAERGAMGAVYATSTLRALPAEALTLVIEREAAFSKLDPDVNRTRIENALRVLATGHGEVAFGQALLEASCGWTRIGPVVEREPFEAKVLNVPGATLAGPWRVEVSTSELEARPGASLAAIDANRVRGVLRVRPLAAGDRIAYHGIERKVADVFAQAKVPRWERAGALAITDGSGVQAVVLPRRTFEAAHSPEPDPYFIRVSATPPR